MYVYIYNIISIALLLLGIKAAKNYEGHLFSPGTVLFPSLFVLFLYTQEYMSRVARKPVFAVSD